MPLVKVDKSDLLFIVIVETMVAAVELIEGLDTIKKGLDSDYAADDWPKEKMLGLVGEAKLKATDALEAALNIMVVDDDSPADVKEARARISGHLDRIRAEVV